jgi:GNAT superfamily N-acetyltransferase
VGAANAAQPSALVGRLVSSPIRRPGGRQLIEELISSLRDHGSPGVRLGVGHANRRAAGFYRHVGATEMPATDVHIFAMALTDPPV